MQTFLPYSNFEQSARSLDMRRLGKQRVEADQILKALRGQTKGWRNHPATKMWDGYIDALIAYRNTMITEWIRRGYRNTMPILPINNHYRVPPWLGDKSFHASHRSNLLRKMPEYYNQFGWTESNDLPYVWPL